MRKEQIIAIFLGSLIGIAVAFGLWRFSRQNTPPKVTPTTSNENSQTQETRTGDNSLNIVSPADNSVISSPEVKITGFAPPNSVMVITSGQTAVGVSTSSGEFNVETELDAGINKATVWAIVKDEVPQKTELTLIYSSKLDLSNPAKIPSTIMGTVTDIAEDGLQVRTSEGVIEQLSLTPETSYAMVNDETKELTFSDLAIGDFIAALGSKTENVMEIERVLVTTAPEPSDIVLISGIIDTLSSKDFIVKTEDDEVSVDARGKVNSYLYSPEGLKSTRLTATATAGDPVVIIGSYEDDELVATTIILL